MQASKQTSGVAFVLGFCLVAGSCGLSQTPGSGAPSSELKDAANELSKGKLDRAEQDLESVLRSDPAEYRALDLLGVVRVLQHRETKAEELFEQAVKAKPDFAPGHAHLGLLYLKLGRPQDALAELSEALRLDPSRTDVIDALAHILEEQAKAASDSGDLNKALGLLLDARKYAPGNAGVQYEFAMVAHKLGLDDDAIEAFQQTLKLRPGDEPALFNLGLVLMERASFVDARKEFAEYVKLRPADAAGHCALGMTLAALELGKDARQEFQRSIELDPAQSESYYRLGLVEMNSGDYDLAAENLHQALEHKPNDPGALTAIGKVEFEKKHYPEAISSLQQAIGQDHSLQEAHYYLGLAFARVGRKQESAEELETSLRLEQEQKERSRNRVRLPQ